MIISDGHIDLAFAFMMRGLSPLDNLARIRQEDALASVALPSMRKGGVKLFFGTLYISPDEDDGEKVYYKDVEDASKKGMMQVEFYEALSLRAKKEEHGFTVSIITDKEGLTESLKDPDDIGIVMLMEGAEPVESPDKLDIWKEKGVRIIGPAWRDTRYSAGAFNRTEGLTDMGRDLLKAMEEQSMILDISHMSQKAVDEALTTFGGKVIATHANARAVCDSPRNLTDEVIKEIARRKGIVGIVFYDGFIKKPLTGRVHISDLMKHIEHMTKVLGGTEHIAIGSDMDGGFGKNRLPFEIESHMDFFKLEKAILEAGLTEADSTGIMGGNWIRFLEGAL